MVRHLMNPNPSRDLNPSLDPKANPNAESPHSDDDFGIKLNNDTLFVFS